MTFSRPTSTLLAVLLIFAIATATFANEWSVVKRYDFDTQPCAGYLAEIEGDNLLVRINGTRFLFYVPDSPGGAYGAEPVEFLEVPSIKQQNRRITPCQRLSDPSVYTEDFAGCSCNLIKVSEVANGVNKTGWEIRIDSCPAPQQDLLFQAYATVTNVTSSQTYYNTMEYSSVSNFSYTSPAGAIKFGVNIQGWNWSVYDKYTENNTYIALPLKFGVRGHNDLKIIQTNSEDYQVVSTFDKYELRMNLDWGYVLNGQGAILNYKFDDSVTNLGAGNGNEWFGFDSAVGFCQPLPWDIGVKNGSQPLNQWDDLYYDPSLQIIFGDFANVAPGASKSSRPSWTVPVSIAVPLGVALIVVVIIILTLTVPSFRRLFVTYFGKAHSLPVPEDNVKPDGHNDQGTSVSSSAAPSQWQPASAAPLPEV